MCNITDLPFRLLCKKYGAALTYSEMIFGDAYLQESERSKKRAYFLEEERPIGIQITGTTTEKIVEASKKIEEELNPDIIDINVGCPSYNVINSGGGGALLKHPEKLSDLVKKLCSSVKTPITCKIRLTDDLEKTIWLAKSIEKAGASALTVHGRTVKQKYSGKADWNIIKKIKNELKIPVILNGDVKDEESTKKALTFSGCNAVMIGRAAIGNPYLFKRITHYLETGQKLEKNLFRRIEIFEEYTKLCKKYGYENLGKIKTVAENLMKGFEGGARIRKKISGANSIIEIKKILEENKDKRVI